MQSEKYTLNREDVQKIITGALIALGGALLTYLSQIITQVDFGVWTPTVVALASILINASKKFLEGK